MDQILGVIGAPSAFKFNNDDDTADKMSHRYTVALLVIFAVVVSTKQYVGDPINCWVPAHFTGNHEEYTNSYCWIKNTYYLPFDDYIPKEHEHDQRQMIPYYQWVPLILLFSALLFYIPRLTWRTLSNRAGIDVDNVVAAAETFQNAEKAENKEVTMDYLTKQMDRFLRERKANDKGTCTLSITHLIARACCGCGQRFGNYLIFSYIGCKVLYILNVIGQLFILDAMLGNSFSIYGIDVLRSIGNGTSWSDSPRFPRVTMCDFRVRRLGNLQRYTVQCVLPINLFNEAIFLFLWFWLVLVACVSILNLIRWITHSVSAQDRKRYIKKHLQLMNKLSAKDERYLEPFVDGYLRSDGIFILRLVGHNTDAVTVTEFVVGLWAQYLRNESPRETDA